MVNNSEANKDEIRIISLTLLFVIFFYIHPLTENLKNYYSKIINLNTFFIYMEFLFNLVFIISLSFLIIYLLFVLLKYSNLHFNKSFIKLEENFYNLAISVWFYLIPFILISFLYSLVFFSFLTTTRFFILFFIISLLYNLYLFFYNPINSIFRYFAKLVKKSIAKIYKRNKI
jgi:hypothetical protein